MSGHELKQWRDRFGLTQQQLADKFGVSRTTVQNWESGVSSIPHAVDMGCQLWGERLTKEQPHLGPVTLVFTDGPMFIDPYGPRRRPAMMQQEAYRSNSAALARVQQLWGRVDFHNPFIIQEDMTQVWNSVELERVVSGDDRGAPTIANMLRGIAGRVRDHANRFTVRNGASLPTPAEAQVNRDAVEREAETLERIADAGFAAIIQDQAEIDATLMQLNKLGRRPPDNLVSAIAEAFVVVERHPVEPEIRRGPGGFELDYKGYVISWPTVRRDTSGYTVNVASESPHLFARLGRNEVINDYYSLENAIAKARHLIDNLG